MEQWIFTIISSLFVVALGAVWRQYLIIRKELDSLKLDIAKHYATNEALKELAEAQKGMLQQMIDLRVDFAAFLGKETNNGHAGKKR